VTDGATLDVAIVSYRCRELLRACLVSLQEHRPQAPMSVWVVDNASGDGTVEMLRAEFPLVRSLALAENEGFARATNRGLREGTAPYALVLNPDTRMRGGTLARLLALMEERPEVGIAGCRLELEDGSFDHASRRSFPTPLGALGHFLWIGRRVRRGPLAQYRATEVEAGPVDAVNGAFMLIRRRALDEVGLFDEGYWMYMEDLDLCYRFKLAGWTTWYEPSVSALPLAAPRCRFPLRDVPLLPHPPAPTARPVAEPRRLRGDRNSTRAGVGRIAARPTRRRGARGALRLPRPIRSDDRAMNVEEIQQRVDAFPRWHYEFTLKGVKTPVFDRTWANRHEQRRAYFFEPLLDRFGGNLRGARVLNLGCNAGYWLLQALQAECEHAVGIDARRMHVEQARLVLEASDISPSRYSLRLGNVLSADFGGPYEVVLCLGLLYHVSEPITILRKIAEANTRVLVVNTSLSTLSAAAFELRRDPLDDPRMAVDCELVLWPTREAVIEATSALGYETQVLEPAFSDWRGCEDYQQGTRRAFLCTKST
jgi:N-acetylglucosaminyl-diphospho-decaprenol L-rhamnosyltransferase